MQIQCPVCNSFTDLSPLANASGSRVCPSCRNTFFLAGDLAFCYGLHMPPSGTSRHRIACPHCQQHYNLPDPAPENPLLGCIKCFKIFAIPVLREENMPTRTIIFPSPEIPEKTKILPEEHTGNTGEAEKSTPSIRVIPMADRKPFSSQETLPPDVFSMKSPSPSPSGSGEKKTVSQLHALPPFPGKGEKKLPPGLTIRMPETQDESSFQMPSGNDRTWQDPAVPIAEGMKEIKFPPPPENMESFPAMPEAAPASGAKNKVKKNASGTFKKIPDEATPIPEQEKPSAAPSLKDPLRLRQYAGNILWLFCGGLAHSILTAIYGGIFCITILGIPLGLQLFKVSKLFLFPFGSEIREKENSKVGCLATGGNVLWIIFGGWFLALGNLIFGGILFCTVIGIPFALQYFKLAKLVLAPFGKEVRRKGNIKDILLCIVIVFILEFIVVPTVASCIRKAVINSITKNVKVIPDGTKNSSSSGKMEESSIDDF